jgi:hypothetical protein
MPEENADKQMGDTASKELKLFTIFVLLTHTLSLETVSVDENHNPFI